MGEQGSDELLHKVATRESIVEKFNEFQERLITEENKLQKIAVSTYVDNEPKQKQFDVKPPDPETDPNPADPTPPPEGAIPNE